jgi:hypothetical protein
VKWSTIRNTHPKDLVFTGEDVLDRVADQGDLLTPLAG